MGSIARRATGCGASAPAPVGVLLPLIFSRGAENRRGAPAPCQPGRRSVGFSRAPPLSGNPKPEHQRGQHGHITRIPASAIRQAKVEVNKRHWSNLHLHMWHLCANTACRRARCCRGNPSHCFDANFPRLPEGVQDWFVLAGRIQQGTMASIRRSVGRTDAARPCCRSVATGTIWCTGSEAPARIDWSRRHAGDRSFFVMPGLTASRLREAWIPDSPA